MKYVLRNRTTGCYLKRAGEWALGIEDAINFDDAGEAREFSQAHRLEDVQAVQSLAPYLMSLLPLAVASAVSGS